ncbi:hypothetical protein MCOR04_001158 [Pyricularia oryzae]|nr:hypothetical protein MCOR13_002771 [Pyricularia oryzae]KAI6605349.1 hypothetical protein MCOR04_001158 [Pyricularia oryzae]
MPVFRKAFSRFSSLFTSRAAGPKADSSSPAETGFDCTAGPSSNIRYRVCQTLSAHGVANAVWFEEVLKAYSRKTCTGNLLLLVSEPTKAADVLTQGGSLQKKENNAVQDRGLLSRGGITIEPKTQSSSNNGDSEEGGCQTSDCVVLLDAAVWDYDLSTATIQPDVLPAPLAKLEDFLGSLMRYWLRLSEEDLDSDPLWSHKLSSLIHNAYCIGGSYEALIKSDEFTKRLPPEVLELHFDLTGDYPGQSDIDSFRKHEYHSMRSEQIQKGTFTPRPYPTGNVPLSLAEYPELTGVYTVLERAKKPSKVKKPSKKAKRMLKAAEPNRLAPLSEETSIAPQTSEAVQLQIMSDLHLETPKMLPMYGDFTIPSLCPHLALLGDIGSVWDERLFTFLRAQLLQFETVFFVMGNHEPYPATDSQYDGSATWEKALSIMQEFEGTHNANMETSKQAALDSESRKPGRFVLLNRRRFDLSPTVTILGATLFSRIADDQRSTTSLFLSDFSNISNWTVDDHNAAHAGDLAWLNREVAAVEQEGRSAVVLTHHSPTMLPKANDPDHLEDDRGVQSAFATDLSAEVCWTSPCVRVWVFGHTHFNCDFVLRGDVGAGGLRGMGKRVVANQRGYGRDDAYSFDPEKVVTIEG